METLTSFLNDGHYSSVIGYHGSYNPIQRHHVIELRPASRDFEQSLQIAYGLTNDACANRTDSRKTNLPLPGYLISVKVTYPAGGVSLNSSYINKQKKRE
jgi:hypothetical protein